MTVQFSVKVCALCCICQAVFIPWNRVAVAGSAVSFFWLTSGTKTCPRRANEKCFFGSGVYYIPVISKGRDVLFHLLLKRYKQIAEEKEGKAHNLMDWICDMSVSLSVSVATQRGIEFFSVLLSCLFCNLFHLFLPSLNTSAMDPRKKSLI